MRTSRAASDESGFTLIELIIATAITGLMTATIAGMLSAVLVNKDATTVRMSQSHDAQSAAAYFAQDVDSMGVRDWVDNTRPLKQSIETGVAYNTGLYPCGVAGTPSALVRMAWNDFDVATPTTAKLDVVAYVVKTTGTATQLHRLLCQGGALLSDTVLVAGLGPGTSIACTPAPCVPPPPPPATPPDPTPSYPTPAAVTVTLTVHDLQNKNPDYQLTLSGHRRQT
jgi:prepilin-type N-terminal cleavage/methylation domain-containing protein